MTAAVIERRQERTSGRSGFALVAGGLATLAIAAGGLFVAASSAQTTGATPVRAASIAATPGAADAGPEIGVTQLTYEPGHTSGWHVHAGVHSVVVLAGTLTVYDRDCQRHQFTAGETYFGGNEAHLARNEGDEPAELAVTYVYTRHGDPGRPLTPGAGCDVR